jgi:arginine decarboxylase
VDQQQTPILQALLARVKAGQAPFYTPGHKQGQGSPPALQTIWGTGVWQTDLSELPGLDNLFAPQASIQQAQELAAAAFGAEQTWFLVNGSTCGIMAAILSICAPGEQIILPRNVHQSAIAGLVLAEAMPIWVEPESDSELAYSLSPSSVRLALQQYPQAKAILLVSPTYEGVCADVAAIANLAHQHQIPLLVDEAHGPHFAFHPDLPPSALSTGADLTVQSTHKVLSALTQAAMLHVQGNRIQRSRLSQSLRLLQSSSPSYLLLASLDAARHQMATEGKMLLSQTLELADQARAAIQQIPGLSVLGSHLKPLAAPQPPPREACPSRTYSGGLQSLLSKSPRIGGFRGRKPRVTKRSKVLQHALASAAPNWSEIDPTRLTVNVTGLGLTGFAADQILDQELGITAELPSLSHLTFIISLGNTEADIQRLIAGLNTLAAKYASPATPSPAFRPRLPKISVPTIAPRTAWYAPTETVAIGDACDRISAELVCPYPPGIPVLLPGEVVTPEAIAVLQQVLEQGGILTGCNDPQLQTLRVIHTV